MLMSKVEDKVRLGSADRSKCFAGTSPDSARPATALRTCGDTLWRKADNALLTFPARRLRLGKAGTIGELEPEMNIEIRDQDLAARIQRQIQATGSGSVEEVLLRLLETQEEQDRWVLENREANNAKIRRGTAQLDRGEGIPEDRLDAYLAELKSKPE